MGFLNKVKNIFFEEEIIEIEEEPKKEEPVAKKIELPKNEKVEKKYDFEEEKIPSEKENKFPMDFDDDDFKEEKEETIEEPYNDISSSVPRRSERRKNSSYDDRIEEVFVDEEELSSPKIEIPKETKYDFELEYGREKESEKPGLYEGKNHKKAFTPTPIISPIYGILDKNYKKDDVVTKKEIRLSSATPKKIDLDTVREKAYGDLTSDISQSMEEIEKDYEINSVDVIEEEDLLYDLNDDSSPAVKKVTVGDAEEYFNELGLEYNIDYKDTSMSQNKVAKEKTRRTTVEEEQPNEEKDEIEETTDGEIESNLFDLIESMYDEKE